MFNAGTQVQVQGRAVKTISAGVYSYGQWSNTVSFGDNVAPGDTFYSVAVTAGALSGAGTFNNTGNTVNVGNSADSSQYITLTFPEDMDRSTKPTASFYYGVATVNPAPHGALNSYWQDARHYRLYVFLPANQDSRFASAAAWYFAINCAGMKDYNGTVLQGTGSIGTAANGITYAAAFAGSSTGNNNVGNLRQCP